MPLDCRRCGTATLSAGSEISQRCPRCGYFTCIETAVGWVDAFSIGDAYSVMRPAPTVQPKALGPERSIEHLTSIRRSVTQGLLEWAMFRPVDAAHLLLQTLREAASIDSGVGADIYHQKGDVFRWVQVLYSLVLASGNEMRAAYEAVSPLTRREADLRSRQVVIVTNLSKLLVRYSRNEIDLRIDEESVQFKERIGDLLGIEFIQNVARAGVDIAGYRLTDASVVDIQNEVLGFALSDLDHKLPSMGISLDSSGFVVVDHEKLTPRLGSLVRKLCLDEDVLRGSEYPDFFDLSPRRTSPRDDVGMVEASSEMLWSMYFPFLPMSHPELEPWSVTARPLIVGPSVAAAGSRSHMLELLRRKSLELDTETKTRVNREIQAYHAEFESLVADRAAAASLQVAHSIRRVRGARLTCGEIDVVCLGRLSNGGSEFLLVVEVKNTDRPMHKAGGIDYVRVAVLAAANQARVKAAWVQSHTSHILGDALNLTSDRTGPIPVFPMIVTREALPLGWSDPIPALTLPEFARECEVMQDSEDFGSWRPDIRRIS